jgi:hypothetical protein
MAEEKSKWDKADIILKPVGGLLTALAVAAFGFFGSRFLAEQQQRDAANREKLLTAETNSRLFAELMSKREEADSSLRKDMFNSIIGTFLKPASGSFEEKVLKLELLSYNFHEALDLGPLFKDVYQEISAAKTPGADQYVKRLERAARDVVAKQVEALEEGGGKLDGMIDFEELRQHPEGLTVLDGALKLQPEGSLATDIESQDRVFTVEALLPDMKRREVRLKLRVRSPGQTASAVGQNTDSYFVFWLSSFDFPLIDNIRLSHGQRCAVVFRTFDDESAQITLVYFPGSKASLKEKPYYDEVVRDLLNGQRLLELKSAKNAGSAH